MTDAWPPPDPEVTVMEHPADYIEGMLIAVRDRQIVGIFTDPGPPIPIAPEEPV